MKKTVNELSQLIGGQVVGDGEIVIEGVTNLEMPQKGFVTFIQDEKHLKKLEKTDLACLIVPPTIQKSTKSLIQSKNPKLAWAKLLTVYNPPETYSGTISEKASIAETAKIGRGVTIGDFVTVSHGAVIDDGAVLLPNTFIGKNAKVGNNSLLHPHVVVYQDCEIGNRVIIHAGTVIGSDGFGYVPSEQGLSKVPQVGNVIIEDDVEIGASTTIDRATIGSTRIGMGTKIDNLVQIAHNVVIGAYSAISSQTGISGSSKIGNQVTMGGKAGVGDHVVIGDGVMVGAGAGLPTGKKIPDKQIIFGAPARPYQEARKQIAAQLRSAEMYQEIKKLRKRVEELEATLSKEKSN